MTADIALPAAYDDTAHRAPALGGFNLTALRLEVRRVLRNRRTLMFVLVFPSMFFFMFRGSVSRSAAGSDVALAYLLISMSVYGAMVGTTAGGAAVAVERSVGWSRQLRLTPLSPTAYIAMKVLTAMVLGLVAVVAAYTIGAISGVHMSPRVWLLSGLGAWASSLVFAAFGLFMGFLLPSENVMQFVGPLLAVLAMFGGLFIPLQLMPPLVQTMAKFSPVYGVGQLARAPLIGGLTATGIAGIVAWTVVFALGAAALFRRDTARV
ncbi:MAG TPA: ABC transporter permease [Gemmatimonadaceae bacterium]|nr:ABC transporter permease [Gemmatimonadaceae bacterium]